MFPLLGMTQNCFTSKITMPPQQRHPDFSPKRVNPAKPCLSPFWCWKDYQCASIFYWSRIFETNELLSEIHLLWNRRLEKILTYFYQYFERSLGVLAQISKTALSFNISKKWGFAFCLKISIQQFFPAQCVYDRAESIVACFSSFPAIFMLFTSNIFDQIQLNCEVLLIKIIDDKDLKYWYLLWSYPFDTVL